MQQRLSVPDRYSTVSYSHRPPILNHSRKNEQPWWDIYWRSCCCQLSVTSYKFQLSPSSDKITHAHTPTCQHSNIRAQGREATKKFSDSNKNNPVLESNLYYLKLHSGVINADLARCTRYRRDEINMIGPDKYWGQYLLKAWKLIIHFRQWKPAPGAALAEW